MGVFPESGRLMLGIETSCDETSVALVAADGTVVGNLVASQVERHRPHGGVVPEIASREHLAHLMPLVDRALREADCALGDLEAIAVTSGPGLIGALLVGVAAAQGLAWASGRPIVPVNHLEGHLFSGFLALEGPAMPVPARFLSLVVSGGHSSVYDVRNGHVTMCNRTRDDAAGEVFDKVAKYLGFPYPGGPHVERAGRDGDPKRFEFPIARFKDESADFSFSGLKSTAIRTARELHLEGIVTPDATPSKDVADLCASFQRSIGDQLIDRLERVADEIGRGPGPAPEEIVFAGGVAANGELRRRVTDWCAGRGLALRAAERRYCTDNAAMIAFAGWRFLAARRGTDPSRIRASSRMPVGIETF